ncbi:MAG: RIO-type serine/threonine-protein kinase Rio2 [Candidatus Methanogaster sp.]|nr:MAG: RIO-type serine/threonine-protein kinase Rio2 [ANME-2 cluster archaeon]
MFNSAIFKKLEKNDFRTLIGIEIGMRQHRWVPAEMLPSFSKLFTEEVRYRINRLLGFNLVKKSMVPYDGYRIHFDGYDALAVGALTLRGLSAIGDTIGVGKESVVYEGMYGGEPVILKFHRAGYTSFKQVARQRDTGDRNHWIFIARRAAKREYEALDILAELSGDGAVSVPRAVDHNRHLIAMSIAPGSELSKTKINDPDWFLDRILEQIKKTYAAGFIHSDLSEYNVFVSPDGVTLIDWPGYVTATHPQAEFLLERDIKNILAFFNRKYGVTRDCEEVVEYVRV